MSTVGAIASGPILFTQSNGSQLSISPYVLRFLNEALVVPIQFAPATEWLNHLVSTGFIKPEPTPVPVAVPALPVMTLTAASPGEWGNKIMATIVYGSSPPSYTVTVSATISFELDTTTMGTVLGTGVLSPDHPAPVFVVGASITSGSTPKNTAVPFSLNSSPLTINTSDDLGTAFQLQARKLPPSGHPIMVTISNAAAGSSKFTLTLGWTAISTNLFFAVLQGAPKATAQAQLATEIGYLVDVVYNGGKPKPGAFLLTGGTDGARATVSRPAVG
jgi:hypothetical protein